MLLARPLALAAWIFLSAASAAQPASTPPGGSPAEPLLDAGLAAYREGRFADALRAFEAATVAEPENPEAHFFLARVLFDTPLRDEGRAGRAIARARRLDPNNIEYLVAELLQLRTDTWNFIQELTRTRRRLALARRILALDSTNAFAHEELGTYHLRDYWQYRNAVALPKAAFSSRLYSASDNQGDVEDLYEIGLGNEQGDLPEMPGQNPQVVEAGDFYIGPADQGAPGALGMSDRFDLASIENQGEAVQDLSGRAEGAYTAAVAHLRSALEADPRRRTVYDHFVRLYALAGRYGEAERLLGQMAVFFPDEPQTWLYLGLANHRLGREEAADVSFREAFERMDTPTRAAFDDLSLLLPEAELAGYRASPEATARRFWTTENPRLLTPYNARRLEHYARLTHADLFFRSDDLGLAGWQTERGRIHVRYGPPQRDVVIVGGYQEVVEAFGQRPEGFAPSQTEQQANVFEVWDYGDFRFVFEDPFQNGEFRLYSPPADLFATAGGGAAADRMDYVRIARETFRETPQRYTYQPPGRAVGLPYRVTAFRSDGGQTDLYVHYGIPIADAFDPETEALVDLPVRTGAFLISDERDLLVERRRTLYGLRSDQVVRFEGAQLWTDTQAMRAAPGRYTVSLEFEVIGGAASGTQRREIAVPDFSGGLALSDLMLAYAVEETDQATRSGWVVRDGVAIRPAPWGVFARAQPLYLYFEAYGLGTENGRSDYEVEARLVPKDDAGAVERLVRGVLGRGRRRGVATEFAAPGAGPDDQQYLLLDAAGQEPGLHTLTLRLRDRISGRTAERETDLMLE